MLILCQETWALAGVTGNLAGTIKDANGAPIAGVQVQAVCALGDLDRNDGCGRTLCHPLAHPRYVYAQSQREGYQSVSFPGVTVFADQTQNVAYTMAKALKTIARVTSQAGSSLVKSGVGSDLYSVNAAQASAAAALGGGGNLNNTYSAMASVPGVQTSTGGIGWDFNAAYVRGQNSFYTGFEYDGIPVNRAFDNYNSSTESTLGLQELQVYTGGGPASVASAGTAGFINQVIKTGTFPGFATANLGISDAAFYHQAQVEAGGSTPDRTFSYYVGLSGYNQTYRFLDNSNGAGYMTPGGIFSGPRLGRRLRHSALRLHELRHLPRRQAVVSGWRSAPTRSNFTLSRQGCWDYFSGSRTRPPQVSDRENVINLHLGIPKHNGLARRRAAPLERLGAQQLLLPIAERHRDRVSAVRLLVVALFHVPDAAPTRSTRADGQRCISPGRCGRRRIFGKPSLLRSDHRCSLQCARPSTLGMLCVHGLRRQRRLQRAVRHADRSSATIVKAPGLYFRTRHAAARVQRTDSAHR